MGKFKVGDEVTRLRPHIRLVVGQSYKVSSGANGWITLFGCYNKSFDSSLFELTKIKPIVEVMQANKPHIHCDLIKQWADGVQIQYNDPDQGWEDCDPEWDVNTEYRVKSKELSKEDLLKWFKELLEDIEPEPEDFRYIGTIVKLLKS